MHCNMSFHQWKILKYFLTPSSAGLENRISKERKISEINLSIKDLAPWSILSETTSHWQNLSTGHWIFSILCLTTHFINQGHEKRKEIRDVSTFTAQHFRAAFSVLHMAQKIVSRQKHNMLSLLHAECFKLLVFLKCGS